MSFIFGGDTDKTYEQLVQERQYLDKLNASHQGGGGHPARAFGNALGKLGTAFFQKSNQDKINSLEKEQLDSLNNDLSSLSTPAMMGRMADNVQGPRMSQDMINQQRDATMMRAFNNPQIRKNPVMQNVLGKMMMRKFEANMPLTPQEKMALQKTQSDIAKNNAMIENYGNTEAIKEYRFAKSQGFKGSFNDFVKTTGRRGQTNTNINLGGQKVASDIVGVGSIPSGQYAKLDAYGNPQLHTMIGKEVSDSGKKDIGFATRMRSAIDILKDDKYTKALTSLKDNVASKAGVLGNYAVSQDYQVANNAMRDFMAAILRKESGAAITQDDQKMLEPVYIPMPGDGDDVLERKRLARQRALSGLQNGMSYNEIIRTGRNIVDGKTQDKRSISDVLNADKLKRSNEKYLQQEGNLVNGGPSQEDPFKKALIDKFGIK